MGSPPASGGARSGIYAEYSDEEMRAIRRIEQRKAAIIGEYSVQIQLDYASAEIKDSRNPQPVEDIHAILMACRPDVVYLHNPADKHDTHVGSMLRALTALRRMPKEARPAAVYGCEVWRDLDWLNDDEKRILDCSLYPNLAASLVGIFDSQIGGGKRYDLATAGRRLANATYFASHGTDECTAMNYAIDLTPLVSDPSLSVREYTVAAIRRFQEGVATKLDALEGSTPCCNLK
jgi:hypothetical protein